MNPQRILKRHYIKRHLKCILNGRGGHILPTPIKTSLKAIFTQIFHITWIWGPKESWKFFKIRFLAQEIPFLRTFSLMSRNSSEIWRSDKNHSKFKFCPSKNYTKIVKKIQCFFCHPHLPRQKNGSKWSLNRFLTPPPHFYWCPFQRPFMVELNQVLILMGDIVTFPNSFVLVFYSIFRFVNPPTQTMSWSPHY